MHATPQPQATALYSAAEKQWRVSKYLILAAFAFCLYWPTLTGLVRQWYSDSNYSHGFLVPIISAWAVWRKRTALLAVVQKPSWWGLMILLSGLGVLGIGVLGAELFLMRASLLLVCAGLVVFLKGWAYFRAVLFPLMFLAFMIPVPAIILTQVTFPLQILASNAAAAVLQVLGVPVLRDGNIINLPAVSLEVVEACSGIRSLLSLLTLAVAYGYVTKSRMQVRVMLALASVPVAVVANSLRIVITGVLAQYSGANAALGFFHEFSGWVVFVISFAGLIILNRVVVRHGKVAFCVQ